MSTFTQWPRELTRVALRLQAAAESSAGFKAAMADPELAAVLADLMTSPSRPPITPAERWAFAEQEMAIHSKAVRFSMTKTVTASRKTVEVEGSDELGRPYPDSTITIRRKRGLVQVEVLDQK